MEEFGREDRQDVVRQGHQKYNIVFEKLYEQILLFWSAKVPGGRLVADRVTFHN